MSTRADPISDPIGQPIQGGATLDESAGGGAAPVAENPIPAFDNILSDIDLSDSDAFTYSAGTTISSATAIRGIDYTAQGTPDYDATAFNNKGGVIFNTAAQALIS